MAQVISIANDMNAKLPFAHYSDMRFNTEQTVFLRDGQKLYPDYTPTVKGAEYNYSDRIWQWDWDKANETRQAAQDSLKSKDLTPVYYEAWLRLYFGKPNLLLVHIITGVNKSNGYDYQVFGYFPEGTADAK